MDNLALRAERPLQPHTQEAAILGLSRPVYKSCCTKHSGVPKHGPSHNFLPKGTSLFTQRGGIGTWSQRNTHGHRHVVCAGRKGAEDQRYRVYPPLRGALDFQNFRLSLTKKSGSEEDQRTRLPQAGSHSRSQAMKWNQLSCG